MTQIIIDSHEGEVGNQIGAYLLEQGLDVTKEALEVGDYLIGEYILERKSSDELADAASTGRLWEQAKALRESSQDKFIPMIVVVGQIPTIRDQYRMIGMKSKKRGYVPPTPKQVVGSLVGVVAGWKVPVVCFPDIDTLAYFIMTLAFRYMKKDIFERPRKHKQHYYFDEIRNDVLCCIPKIGRKKATKILEKFDSIDKFINASKDEIINDKSLRVNEELYEAIIKVFKE